MLATLLMRGLVSYPAFGAEHRWSIARELSKPVRLRLWRVARKHVNYCIADAPMFGKTDILINSMIKKEKR